MLKLLAIGNLGKDCVVNTANGKSVINFSVAHTESFTNNQGIKEQKTTWVECSYWPQSTGIAPYLKKGTMVYVEGVPEVVTYNKNGGGTGVSLKLRVFQVQLLGAKKSDDESGTTTYQSSSNKSKSDISGPVDDLPF